MFDTVECPYCGHENDMSDGLTDLPSDNKFDHDCSNCGEEFEVEVEFEPSYSASKIVYAECEKCGVEVRDIYTRNRIFPYPKHLKENNVCYSCFCEGMKKEFERRSKMGQPLEYNQLFYNEVIYYLEQKWNRRLNDHERHCVIEGYRYGRLKEAENEIKIIFAK